MFIGLRVVWESQSVIAYVNRGNNSLRLLFEIQTANA